MFGAEHRLLARLFGNQLPPAPLQACVGLPTPISQVVTDAHTHTHARSRAVSSCPPNSCWRQLAGQPPFKKKVQTETDRHRQTDTDNLTHKNRADKPTDRQKGRHRHRQTDRRRQTNRRRQTDRDKQTQTQTQRQRQRQKAEKTDRQLLYVMGG